MVYTGPTKKIYELIENFRASEDDVDGNEGEYWTIFDYSKHRTHVIPLATSVHVLHELFLSMKHNGVTNSDGDPHFFFGEKLGNTRPLAVDFTGVLKRDTVGDDGVTTNIYRILIAAMTMALSAEFELTGHGKEHRVCSVLYSTDQNSSDFEATIYFPYCRMKKSDFVDLFMPRLTRILDGDVGENLFSAFVGVGRSADIIANTTYEDVIPLFGSARSESEYPKNKADLWIIHQIPTGFDDGVEGIMEGDDDMICATEHCLFDAAPAFRPTNAAGEVLWRPLIYTNSFWRQRVHAKGGEQRSFGQRRSPYMRRVDENRPRPEGLEAIARENAEKNIIRDVIQHVMDNDDYRTIPESKRNAVVRFIRYEKYMTEIQDLINLFAVKEKWFDIQKPTEQPPILVGNGGFYLAFSHLSFVLDHLDSGRCSTTSVLNDIACITYTMARTSEEKEEARHLFVEFVRGSPKDFRRLGSDAGVSELFFGQVKRAAKRRLTFWTLLNMFEEDDSLYYQLWWKYICDYYAIHTLDSEMASFPVARAASLPIVGKYLHTTGDARPTWWRYTGTHWENVHDSQGIELGLTTTFLRTLNSVATRYPDIVQQKSTKKVSFNTLRDKIQESNFRSGIVRDMGNVLLQDNRLIKFSSGNDGEFADYFASINFVYQYSDGEMKRRRGHWEDFLTKSFDVIDECLPITDARCQWIISWVHKMLRDPETEHQFLKEISSYLRGFNREKRFSVWYGHGNGGKSKFMDLLGSTLGMADGYAVNFPLETLLEGAKKSSGSASPEIDQARGAFLAILNEPKKGQKFDAGKIKAITGNDPMYNRTLFSKGGTFRPMFKTVLLGNVLPKADYDMAMKIRFWVWWFKGRFADDEECPSTEEEQERLGIYPIDKDLDTKLPEYRPAMLAVLLHYFKYYCREGIRKVEGIRLATDMFWNSANDVMCFLSENTVKTSGEEYAETGELYDCFRRWFMKRNNGERVITNLVFLEELSAIYTSQNIREQGGVSGIRIREGI